MGRESEDARWNECRRMERERDAALLEVLRTGVEPPPTVEIRCGTRPGVWYVWEHHAHRDGRISRPFRTLAEAVDCQRCWQKQEVPDLRVGHGHVQGTS